MNSDLSIPERGAAWWCPVCDGLTASRVLETRVVTLNQIRRRRECLGCLGTFATIERVAPMRRPPRARRR